MTKIWIKVGVVRRRKERKGQRNVGGRKRKQEKVKEKRNVQRKRGGGEKREPVGGDNFLI